MPNTKHPLLPIICIGLPFGLYGWAIFITVLLGKDGTIAPLMNGVGTDWAMFFTAARAWFGGTMQHLYDQVWFKPALADVVSGSILNLRSWSVDPLIIPAFNYPPTFLLLLLPFGAMPFAASYALGQIVGLGALIAALKTYAPSKKDAARLAFVAGAVFLSPALSYNVQQGQNGTVVLALTVFGLALLDKRPMAAGVVFGLLAFKPQSAFLIPLALIAARQWKAFWTAGAVAALFVAVSVAVFGIDTWMHWADLFLHPRHDVALTGIAWGHQWDESVETCARLLGGAGLWPMILQAAAIVLAGGLVFGAYRSRAKSSAKFCILLAASVVASPHSSPYDMIPLALAGALYLWTAVREPNYRPIFLILPLLLWLAPFFCPARAFLFGQTIPLLIFLFLIQIIVQTPALLAAFWPGSRRNTTA